jgi:hypothetical protein
MQPDPTHLLEIVGPDIPLVGFYDAPDPSPFSPLVRPTPGPQLASRRNAAHHAGELWLSRSRPRPVRRRNAVTGRVRPFPR